MSWYEKDPTCTRTAAVRVLDDYLFIERLCTSQNAPLNVIIIRDRKLLPTTQNHKSAQFATESQVPHLGTYEINFGMCTNGV